jgi:aconitate hydratase
MVNGLGVLGWGVGGIEAEAAMLGQPISMLMPEVVGFKLTGKLQEGVTATDLVLTVTQMLRKKGVVGKFVEFYGPGLDTDARRPRHHRQHGPGIRRHLRLLPGRRETLDYLASPAAKRRSRAGRGLLPRRRACSATKDSPEPVFTDTLELDLGDVEPSLAGPKRPQDRVDLLKGAEGGARGEHRRSAEGPEAADHVGDRRSSPRVVSGRRRRKTSDLGHGDVVIAAITSCTNTSNPSRADRRRPRRPQGGGEGPHRKPWVKTSLAPGIAGRHRVSATSRACSADLDALGFNLVGYGCTTCIGNSGPLPDPISKPINDKEPRCRRGGALGQPQLRGPRPPRRAANYLASPPLVVAYALAGSMHDRHLTKEPLGKGKDGKPVYLKRHLADEQEIADIDRARHAGNVRKKYADVFKGDANWQGIARSPGGETYRWDDRRPTSQNPPYFEGMGDEPAPRVTDIARGARARPLRRLDHHRPHLAGRLDQGRQPAGKYLIGATVCPPTSTSTARAAATTKS